MEKVPKVDSYSSRRSSRHRKVRGDREIRISSTQKLIDLKILVGVTCFEFHVILFRWLGVGVGEAKTLVRSNLILEEMNSEKEIKIL